MNTNQRSLIVHWLGRQAYEQAWQAMKAFTDARDEHTTDEIWLLEHDPVFTQGQNGKPEHLLCPGDIPVIKTDRGGQVTYHGPGQLIAYTLIDLKRHKMNIREFVCAIEKSVIALLSTAGLTAHTQAHAPGIYIGNENHKICSIGLRIRRGYAYHGIALNIDMDLEPFTRIHPCGFQELTMTQLAAHLPTVNTHAPHDNLKHFGIQFTEYVRKQFGYTELELRPPL